MNRRSQSSRANSANAARRQRGSVVVYLALALVAFGVMAMAGASRFGASVMGVSAPNCSAQARMMAESGVRYATARLRTATDQTTLTAMIATLNGQTLTVDPARGLEFTLSVTASGPGAAQVSATGKACGNLSGGVSFLPSTSTQASAGVNVPAVTTGGGGVSFEEGDTPGFIPTEIIGGSGAIAVDPATGTVTLGGDVTESSGSLWYSGTKDVCVDGNCTLGSGLRAYFDLAFSSTAEGDGFVWAIMSAETNTNASSGGDPNMGELVGYGGPGALGLGIQPPKFGVEFDIYENSGTASACNVGNRGDSGSPDHLAFIFWGTETLACSGKTQPTTYDDNRHGAGAGSLSQPRNSANDAVDGPGNVGYYIRPSSGSNWLQDGGQYRFRYELLRNTTANAQGNYCYKLRAWMKRSTDTIATGMDNTTADYNSPPELYRTFYLSQAMHDKMSKIFFGWSEGTGAATQLVTISNFKLNFREGDAPAYSPPPDYTAGWPMYEGSGTTVHNSNATNPVDGVIGGSGTAWVTGLGCPACSALSFNGSGYVVAPENNSLDLTTAGAISAWILPTALTNDTYILHKGDEDDTSDEAFGLRFSTGGKLELRIRWGSQANRYVLLESAALPAVNKWYHVVAQWDANTLAIYINGTLSSVATNSNHRAARNTAGDLVIGARHTASTPYQGFNGYIDEVYLYKRLLTAAEIAALAIVP
ncbi:MAG: LamG domain-containing protein [Humidesulfovibrio sp.]